MTTNIKANKVQQRPLNLLPSPLPHFDHFHVGHNQLLCRFLLSFCSSDESNACYEPLIYLWGQVGSGRTHLLQACCHAFRKQSLSCTYLTFHKKEKKFSEIQEEHIFMKNYQLICIDDIEQVLGKTKSYEVSLFNLYQHVLTHGHTLMVAASCSPKQLPCLLPDLQSRLSSGLTFHVQALSDAQKKQVMQHRAAFYGLTLTDHVTHFLLTHYARDLGGLLQQIDRLNQASFIEKQPITIPLVKRYLTEV